MKIGMCGCFATGEFISDGQIVKTNTVYACLSELTNVDAVFRVDSYYWKKRFIKLFIECILLIKRCDHIVILPAENGMRVFVPLFLCLNKIYKKRIHIIAIGGWLADAASQKKNLIKQLSRINSIHVESRRLVEALKAFGITNVFYMPNIKKIEPIQAVGLVNNQNKTLSLCTFSRVLKEKGIELAIKSVYEANKIIGKEVYKVDIYGMIDDKYKFEFEELLATYHSCVTYKGFAASDKSVSIIKAYSALMFLTFYEGEGFAGTLLDSMAAGVPVIASNWKYNPEIIIDGCNGFLCETNNISSVVNKLVLIYENQDALMNMRLNCLEQYKQYDHTRVIQAFIKIILNECNQ